MGDNKTNSDKLQELLTFDAAKKHNLTQELMSEVVKEITEERVKEAKTRAKEQLVKAMQLREQMAKAKRDFDNQYQKMEKELGKIMNQIQGILTGKNPDPEEAKEEAPA
jgi:CRISPR/Cas system CSM-associated protein Csm2 small subunit